MADISQQECINLALDVFKKKGLLPLRNAAAKAFDVHISAFKTKGRWNHIPQGTSCQWLEIDIYRGKETFSMDY